tara:strand:+ start:346 stop:759 length:414 start_codon:yes stop_codon:yes gene_type:complete
MAVSGPCEVLLVEGDPLLRFTTMELVTDAGLSGHSVGQAIEALAALAGNAEIGILVSAIGLPGSLNGLELVKIVYRRWPHIKIIIISGASNVTPENLPPGGTFLAKPYLAEAVIACLKSAASIDRNEASLTARKQSS